ncbi:MAG: hypothetical protein RL254_831, partial [Planctomycetota bacterium]
MIAALDWSSIYFRSSRGARRFASKSNVHGNQSTIFPAVRLTNSHEIFIADGAYGSDR